MTLVPDKGGMATLLKKKKKIQWLSGRCLKSKGKEIDTRITKGRGQ